MNANAKDRMERMLDATRAELEPSLVDRARVKRALGMKLTGMGAAIGVGKLTKTAAASPASGAAVGATTGTAALTSGGLIKLFLSSAALTLAGTTTMLVVTEAGPFRQSAAASSDIRMAEPTSRPMTGASAVAPVPPHTLPPHTLPPHTLPPPPEPVQPSAAPARIPSVAAESPAAGTRSTLSTGDLDAELGLLQKSRQAIGAGQPQAALITLAELERKHPQGVLLEERAALRAMALCQTLPAAARPDRARAFLSRHPTSVYATRVGAACSGGEPNLH